MDPTRTLDDVPGWFRPVDRLLFEWILRYQTEHESPGDAAELGVFKGKSAIHIARFLAEGETFTVCDLFDDAATEDSIRQGVRSFYDSLSQAEFEKNFLDFHPKLPVVVRGLSSVITEHVAPGSCRFVHVDASHQYEHVRQDCANARTMLRDGGVVVFDDYRTTHTIGTSAAVWEAINRDDLVPICASPMKLYATWGDPAALQSELYRRLAERRDHFADPHTITDGNEIIRVAPIKSGQRRKEVPPPPRHRMRQLAASARRTVKKWERRVRARF